MATGQALVYLPKACDRPGACELRVLEPFPLSEEGLAMWTPVEESLPRYGQRVMVSMLHKNYPKNDHIGLARRVRTDAEGEWWQYDWSDSIPFKGVTFWLGLPAPPRLPADSTGDAHG
jgi:hypothetical protein